MESQISKRTLALIKVAVRPLQWLQPYQFNIFRNSTTTAAVDLAYKVYGSVGKLTPILVLHGMLGSKRNWDSMAKRINASTKRPVIAVDARNHGDSPNSDQHTYLDLAADVDKLMSKLIIKEAILIGHSMGGRTAMTLALSEPAKVSSLIVVDISPVPAPLSDWFPRIMDVMKSVKFKAKDVPTAKDEAKYKLKSSGLIDEDAMMNFLLTNIGEKNGKIGWKCNVDVIKNHYDSIASFPTEVAGKVYQGPTLFINGKESSFVPQEDIKTIQTIFPQVAIYYVEKAGHNVHADNPDIFHSLVTKFITEYSLK